MFETILITLFFIVATVTLFFLIRAYVVISLNQIKEAAYKEGHREGYNQCVSEAYWKSVEGYHIGSMGSMKGTYCTIGYYPDRDVVIEPAPYFVGDDDFLCTNCGGQALKSETDGEFCSVDCVNEYNYHTSNAWGR